MRAVPDGLPTRRPAPDAFDSGLPSSSSRFSPLWRPSTLVVALGAALFHIAPTWYAQATTPPGWTFTGNVTVSPDEMQYRVWERQSQREGVIVSNAFTSEPSRPYLIVAHAWLVGRLALLLGQRPEFVSDYLGCVWAMGLAILLTALVTHFFPDSHQKWWVLAGIMLGGGLGAHLKILALTPGLRDNYLVNRLVTEPLATWPMFEDYRSHYVVKALADTPFAFLWLVSLGAMVAFYAALRRFSPGRVALTVLLFAAITLLHVYEGVTLVAAAAGIALCCRVRGLAVRSSAILLGLCSAAVLACYALLGALFRHSGLPMPPWRAVNILLSVLLIAYPVAWGLLAVGLRNYWRRAGLGECVLVGWALGCTVVTLSGPFYPYPDRGTMTLQVPLTLIAGGIYFAWRSRVHWRAAVVAVLLMGATPTWFITRTIVKNRFHPDWPWAWTDAAHENVIRTLRDRANSDDILLAEQTDELWLAPAFPGRSYVGHFFLTVDYESKVAALERFLSDTAMSARRDFLDRSGARFIFVNAGRHPEQFAELAGLVPIVRNSAGWLFENQARATAGHG